MKSKAPARNPENEHERIVPEGTPDWITEDLIVETLQTWQPYYGGSLTAEDAVEILIGVTKLFEFISET